MQPFKKIDIHVHSVLCKGFPRPDGGDFTTPDELRAMYDRMGIEFGVQLPSVSPEGCYHLITNEESAELARRYPETYLWFCNLDPRWMTNLPDADLSQMIAYYRAHGARGVGEVTANLPFDHPYMQNLFAHVQRSGLPMTIHIGKQGGDYGIVDEPGLPGLERTLARFPGLKILGHSQRFWAEISGDCSTEQRAGYPEGRVAPGGRVVMLMRKYPNLLGDLSAKSGGNAVMRDADFGCAFLEEFADRLYFGTDICDPRNDYRLTFWLDEMLQQGRIRESTYRKICRENAEKLLGL
ncbi:MAG: amidohydrolase family protein [Clostridia bacterium]|nr:amidohydrolase family protein [Clostridia bacterium]